MNDFIERMIKFQLGSNEIWYTVRDNTDCIDCVNTKNDDCSLDRIAVLGNLR